MDQVTSQVSLIELPFDKKGWYSVECSDDAFAWLQLNFQEDKDFYVRRFLKGVWIDVPERIYVMMVLKFK